MDTILVITNLATIVGVIVAIAMLIITVKSLNSSVEQFNEQLQLNVFTDYTKRYQEIMLSLPESVNDDDFSFYNLKENEKEKKLKYMRAYFDLCSEEYFLYGQGKIGKDTWHEWNSGIKYAFSKAAFIESWQLIRPDSGFYPEFVKFAEKIISKNITKSCT